LKHFYPDPNDKIWSDEHQVQQSNLSDFHGLTIDQTSEQAVDSNK
jgi:hypothetical protein